MRWEQDQVGVSLFVEHGPAFDAVVAATVPPSVLLLFGALATMCGLDWAGPALLFVGLAMWITVPLALAPSRHTIRVVRVDHRGIRIDDQPIAHGVILREIDTGLMLGERFLPIDDAEERMRVHRLLEGAMDRQLEGEIPPELARLREQLC